MYAIFLTTGRDLIFARVFPPFYISKVSTDFMGLNDSSQAYSWFELFLHSLW